MPSVIVADAVADGIFVGPGELEAAQEAVTRLVRNGGYTL